MKFSTRVEYGVIALVDIAKYSDSKNVVTAVEISKRQGISKKYLEQILPLLRQDKMIKAQKGINGGYHLAKDTSKITMYDVVNALDPKVFEEMEIEDGEDNGELKCAVNKLFWDKINRSMIEFAKEKTLSNFVKECEDETMAKWDMYVI